MTQNIIWIDGDTGYDQNNITVYSLKYGIKRAIDDYIHYICRHPLSIQQLMKRIPVDGPSFSSTESISFNLSMIYLKPSTYHLTKLIKDVVHNFIMNEINNNNDLDILFMAKIGYKRDWKKDCPICLTEKTGDPRGWGGYYCKITLFRPCGHSICTECNKDLTKCPLCRENINQYIKHNYARFDDDVIEKLTNTVLKIF